MAGPLKEIKNALKELSLQYNLEPIHTARPKLWRHLNELLKNYRDFFLHPNPDHFQKYVGETGNAQWCFASDTASGILEYIYEGCRGEAPKWVNTSGLQSLGFKVVDI